MSSYRFSVHSEDQTRELLNERMVEEAVLIFVFVRLQFAHTCFLQSLEMHRIVLMEEAVGGTVHFNGAESNGLSHLLRSLAQENRIPAVSTESRLALHYLLINNINVY